MEQQQQMIEKVFQKKKYYQKWWFWVIIVFMGIMIISLTTEDDSPDTQNSNSTESAIAGTSQTTIDEYKSSCKNYSYENLARNPDTYKDKKVKLRGEVVQVIENGKKIDLRIYMDEEYDDTVYVTYTLKSGEDRILEDDILMIYGTFEGLVTYETVLGAKVTVPYVEAAYIERIS